MEHVRFRPARTLDLPEIFLFERAYLEQFEPASVAGWTRALDRNLRLWIENLGRTVVAEDDGELIGYQMWMPRDGGATLISLHVAESRRRGGLGRGLLRRFVADARAAGHQVLNLGVHEGNPARGLYLAEGFEQTGTDGDYLLLSRR
jgi:ribosomal protein S18 acetylase RimI-like enzyme